MPWVPLKLLIVLKFYACDSLKIILGDFRGIHKATCSPIVEKVSRIIAFLVDTRAQTYVEGVVFTVCPQFKEEFEFNVYFKSTL